MNKVYLMEHKESRIINDLFPHKCICMWSKDDEYGFVPNTKCEVHGKNAKNLLKNKVDIKIKDLNHNKKEKSNRWGMGYATREHAQHDKNAQENKDE